MVTASYRSLRNCADTTGAKSLGRPIGGRSDSITGTDEGKTRLLRVTSCTKVDGGPLVTTILKIIRLLGRAPRVRAPRFMRPRPAC